MTNEVSPEDQILIKFREGIVAIRVAHEALTDVAFILETQLEDLEFMLRSIAMDQKWREVMP